MARQTNDEGLYLGDDALRARIAPHVGAIEFAKILVDSRRPAFRGATGFSTAATGLRSKIGSTGGIGSGRLAPPWRRMVRRTGMSKRGRTPGLIRRRRADGEALYWSAKNLARDLRDFPDPLIRLPPDATAVEATDLCEMYTARLALWLAGEARPRWLYDGSIGSLADVFERHRESPIHEVGRTPPDYCDGLLKVIRATIGARAVRAVTPIDAKAWHRLWREPRPPSIPTIRPAPSG